jgi:hypothetical protein
LLVLGSTAWKPLVSPDTSSRATAPYRGRANPAKKPSKQQVWGQVEWIKHPQTGRRVGYVSHFLEAMGLPSDSMGKRAAAFNTLLEKRGVEDRLEQRPIPHKSGKPPWLASRAAMSALHDEL